MAYYSNNVNIMYDSFLTDLDVYECIIQPWGCQKLPLQRPAWNIPGQVLDPIKKRSKAAWDFHFLLKAWTTNSPPHENFPYCKWIHKILRVIRIYNAQLSLLLLLTLKSKITYTWRQLAGVSGMDIFWNYTIQYWCWRIYTCIAHNRPVHTLRGIMGNQGKYTRKQSHKTNVFYIFPFWFHIW